MNKLLCVALLMCAQTVNADWQLDSKASQLNFTTTKNASKTEVQAFSALQGTIKDKQATLSVDLNTVDTGIDIRDSRLKELFFEVVKFPKATVSLDISQLDLATLNPGQAKAVSLNAHIDLHGVKQDMPVMLQVVGLANHKLLVVSAQPLIVDLAQFDLLAGVQQLQELAKLDSINAAVPVTFTLFFTQK